MARHPSTPDCGIRGCKRAALKSGLCKTHQRFVPIGDSLALSAEIMRSANAIAKRHHKRWVKYVQVALDSGNAVERPPIVPHPNWELGVTAALSLRA